MLKRKRGKTKFMFFPMTASTPALVGELMAWSSGQLIIATATTAGHDIAGVLRHSIASTDKDYATGGRLVEVEVPCEKNVEWEMTTASLVATDVGLYCDITAGDGTTVTVVLNRAASTYDIALVVGVISATLARVVLNIGADADAKT